MNSQNSYIVTEDAINRVHKSNNSFANPGFVADPADQVAKLYFKF